MKELEICTVKKGGSGCICPESALLKTLLMHLVICEDDLVIMYMEAGIEHLGRGTAVSVDMFIVVVEPGRRSIETAGTIKKLARDIEIKKIAFVGNKIRKKSDEDFIRDNLKGEELIGFIPYNESIIEADMKGDLTGIENSEIIKGIVENL